MAVNEIISAVSLLATRQHSTPFPMHFTANIVEDNDSSGSCETDFPSKVSCLETTASP